MSVYPISCPKHKGALTIDENGVYQCLINGCDYKFWTQTTETSFQFCTSFSITVSTKRTPRKLKKKNKKRTLNFDL